MDFLAGNDVKVRKGGIQGCRTGGHANVTVAAARSVIQWVMPREDGAVLACWGEGLTLNSLLKNNSALLLPTGGNLSEYDASVR